MTAVLAFLGSLAVLLPLGIPICFVLVCCGIVLMQVLGMTDSIVIAQNMVSGTNNFALMAIPFFMLAGEIMGAGGLSRRIVDFANVVVGRVRGGLGCSVGRSPDPADGKQRVPGGPRDRRDLRRLGHRPDYSPQ